MNDQTLTFRSGDLTLAGTLTRPGEPNGTVAVLVSGSGRVDRDSDDRRIALGVARMLAEHLTGLGVSTFRYDKRGVGESDGDYLRTGLHDNVEDAAAAVAAVRAHLGDVAQRVVLVGHSEGAQIGMVLAAREGLLDAAVLLAGAAVTGRAVLEWQAERVSEVLPAVPRALVRLLRIDVAKGQRRKMDKLAATTTDVTRDGPVKVNAKWFREFLAFDPAPVLAAATVPVLAITGTNDIQVDPGDVERMRDLIPTPFEGHVVPGVNHLLRAGDPSPTTYRKQVGMPIDERVLALLTDWFATIADRPTDGAHA